MSDMRLIDADKLKRILYNITNTMQDNGYSSYAGALGEAANIVDNQPTISAVPVVRCSECKHFVKYDDDYRDEHNCDGYCEKISYIMDGYYHGAENRKADDFCSLGAKKDAKDIDVPTKDGGADNV